MLLTIDIGNSETAAGLFLGDTLTGHWRTATRPEQTEDEKAVELANLMTLYGTRPEDLTGVCIASVVPAAGSTLFKYFSRFPGLDVLEVRADVVTGMTIDYDRPDDVGADRIANAVGGFDRVAGPLIIVDFGTATTFDVISEDGSYIGGAIAPGVVTGAEALISSAARLSRVPLEAPVHYVGRRTEDSLRSGLIFGAAALVDGMVAGIKRELGGEPRVLATGGLADAVAPHCRMIDAVEPLLTLSGLKKIWELNR